MKFWLLAFLFLANPAFGQEGPTTRELLSIVNERSSANSQRFEAQEKAVAAALAAAKEAVAKAEGAAEKRFDSVNEFRSTLKDQQSTLITRNEVDVRLKSLDDKIALNALQLAQLVSKAEGVGQLWGFISVGLGILIAASSALIAFRSRRQPTR